MKLPVFTTSLLAALVLSVPSAAQQKRTSPSAKAARPGAAAAGKSGEIGQTAVVIDETLSVLRAKPSLFSISMQRMRLGRKVQILGTAEADGVRFYRVTAPPSSSGWVQSDAVFGPFRPGDEHRLATLIQASSGFEQIEIAFEFFELYPNSRFRPLILLLVGDLLEEVAAKLSKDAGSRLSRKEMAASGAPMHSYYLNFVSLDRYRRLGVLFLFNPATKTFHYDGGAWSEIARMFSSSPEAAEARKRLETLKLKMEAPPAK